MKTFAFAATDRVVVLHMSPERTRRSASCRHEHYRADDAFTRLLDDVVSGQSGRASPGGSSAG